MADIILEPNDFKKSPFQLAVTIDTEGEIQESIDRVQNNILDKFLGTELLELFNTEYVDPIPDKWKDFINGLNYENSSVNYKIQYEGFKKALKGFIYADYLEKDSINTDGGQAVLEKSNTERLGPDAMEERVNNKYNEGVNIYLQARLYMYENKDTFPEWNYSGLSMR